MRTVRQYAHYSSKSTRNMKLNFQTIILIGGNTFNWSVFNDSTNEVIQLKIIVSIFIKLLQTQ